jgi:hypothetical protein
LDRALVGSRRIRDLDACLFGGAASGTDPRHVTVKDDRGETIDGGGSSAVVAGVDDRHEGTSMARRILLGEYDRRFDRPLS